MLEYHTYPLWLYDEDGEIIDNGNPPEWDDDKELTNAFMTVCDFYDTFFINNEREFSFVGSKNPLDAEKLQRLMDRAMKILYQKNNGKYMIQNDMHFNLNPEKTYAT